MDTHTVCQSCDKPAAWHRRQVEYLEQTIGPEAGLRFESEHPEADDDEEGGPGTAAPVDPADPDNSAGGMSI
jgi:hypothetical protein